MYLLYHFAGLDFLTRAPAATCGWYNVDGCKQMVIHNLKVSQKLRTTPSQEFISRNIACLW